MIPEGFMDIPNCTILRDSRPRSSQGAYLVDCDALGQVWIPKANVHDDSEVPMTPDTATMYVAEWFCDLKGWTDKL